MRIKILQGRAAGSIEEFDEPTGQSLLDSGFGVLASEEDAGGVSEVTDAPAVAEEADVPEADTEDAEGGWADSYTISELEDLADEYKIEAKDIQGTGSGGGVVKADWVRVLDEAMDKEAAEDAAEDAATAEDAGDEATENDGEGEEE